MSRIETIHPTHSDKPRLVRCALPPVIAKTRVLRYADTPSAGRWIYRLAVLSGTPPPVSDPIEVSCPVTVRTR